MKLEKALADAGLSEAQIKIAIQPPAQPEPDSAAACITQRQISDSMLLYSKLDTLMPIDEALSISKKLAQQNFMSGNYKMHRFYCACENALMALKHLE